MCASDSEGVWYWKDVTDEADFVTLPYSGRHNEHLVHPSRSGEGSVRIKLVPMSERGGAELQWTCLPRETDRKRLETPELQPGFHWPAERNLPG